MPRAKDVVPVCPCRFRNVRDALNPARRQKRDAAIYIALSLRIVIKSQNGFSRFFEFRHCGKKQGCRLRSPAASGACVLRLTWSMEGVIAESINGGFGNHKSAVALLAMRKPKTFLPSGKAFIYATP